MVFVKFIKNNKIKSKNILIYFLVILSYLFLGYRFFDFIYKYTTNILFWDQWNHVESMMTENNFFKLFLVQNNEHRIGIGLIISKFLLNATEWNSISETLFIGFLIFLSSIFALLIKFKIFKKIEIYDSIIPYIFLNLYQWENLIWGFQITFVLPLFCLLFCLYLFTFSGSLLRNFLIIIFCFISAYSSFQGLFLLIISSIFFFIDYIIVKTKTIKFSIIITVLLFIGASYFIDLQSSASFASKSFHVHSLIQFIFFQINGFIGHYSYNFYYLVIPFLVIVSFCYLLFQSQSKKKLLLYYPIISLYFFSFLFSVSTAFGRMGLDIRYGFTSRYVTFMIPLYLGMYLVNNQLNQKIISSIFFVIFIYVSSINNHLNYQEAIVRSQILSSWRNCLRINESYDECFILNQSKIYPSDKKTFLDQLYILNENKLNLFSEE